MWVGERRKDDERRNRRRKAWIRRGKRKKRQNGLRFDTERKVWCWAREEGGRKRKEESGGMKT